MSFVSIGDCGYCLVKDVPVTSTPETDILCIDCLRLTRDNCSKAIRELSEFSMTNNTKPRKMEKSIMSASQEDAFGLLTKNSDMVFYKGKRIK